MRRREEEQGINMTPMIDIVFQLIIFFVVTIDMQNKDLDMKITQALAPNGRVVKTWDPRTVKVDVDKEGRIFIARAWFSPQALRSTLRSVVARTGSDTPVVIRADVDSRHEAVRKVIDACSAAGIGYVTFSAVKEAAAAPVKTE